MKIPVEKRVRTYELTYLVSPDFSKEKLEEIKDKVTQIIKKAEGEVKEVEEWGKKEMAYSIKKNGKRYETAIYFHIVFTAESTQIAAITNELDIEEEIIRYLLVVVSE